VTKIKRFAKSTERVFDDAAFGFLKIAIVLVSVFIIMFIEVRSFALMLFAWALLLILITALRARKQTKLDLFAAEEESHATGVLTDILENAVPTKTYTAHDLVMKRFEVSVESEAKRKEAAWGYMNWQWFINGSMMLLLEIGGMSIAIYQFQSGIISIGTVVLVQVYIAAIGQAMWSLGHAIMGTRRAFADSIEMSDIMDTEPDLLDPVQPSSEIDLTKGIVFDEVGFKYNGSDHIFRNFNLTIPNGQKVGLVGFSGSGKTSITKIILRLIDVEDGAMFIGGVDSREMTQSTLRSHIAFVPQDPSLFHISIGNNIGIGKLGASMEEIIDAAKKAHIHDFILSLDQGYDTLVGERGVKLSGGQRQRVAIARAILRNAHIIVLDEASSSLDSVTEDSLQQVLLEEFKGKTVIVIAHRLSTVANLDRLIVLDQGVIVQDGAHKELAQVEGIYKELWDRQSSPWLV